MAPGLQVEAQFEDDLEDLAADLRHAFRAKAGHAAPHRSAQRVQEGEARAVHQVHRLAQCAALLPQPLGVGLGQQRCVAFERGAVGLQRARLRRVGGQCAVEGRRDQAGRRGRFGGLERGLQFPTHLGQFGNEFGVERIGRGGAGLGGFEGAAAPGQRVVAHGVGRGAAAHEVGAELRLGLFGLEEARALAGDKALMLAGGIARVLLGLVEAGVGVLEPGIGLRDFLRRARGDAGRGGKLDEAVGRQAEDRAPGQRDLVLEPGDAQRRRGVFGGFGLVGDFGVAQERHLACVVGGIEQVDVERARRHGLPLEEGLKRGKLGLQAREFLGLRALLRGGLAEAAVGLFMAFEESAAALVGEAQESGFGERKLRLRGRQAVQCSRIARGACIEIAVLDHARDKPQTRRVLPYEAGSEEIVRVDGRVQVSGEERLDTCGALGRRSHLGRVLGSGVRLGGLRHERRLAHGQRHHGDKDEQDEAKRRERHGRTMPPSGPRCNGGNADTHGSRTRAAPLQSLVAQKDRPDRRAAHGRKVRRRFLDLPTLCRRCGRFDLSWWPEKPWESLSCGISLQLQVCRGKPRLQAGLPAISCVCRKSIFIKR